MKRAAVLAPGYGGTAEQPILRKLEAAFDGFGIASQAVTFRTRGTRPSKDYASEIDDLRAARNALRAAGFELELGMQTRPVLDRQLLDDVPRILALSPEARLREVANLSRFLAGAKPNPRA